MEDILEIYEQPYDPQFPWLCLDEKSYQLLQHMCDSIPPKEGQPAKEDYEYKPQGTCNLFMLVAPKAGWRDVKITDR